MAEADAEAFVRCPLLEGMDERGIEELMGRAQVREVAAGERLLTQGAHNQALLVLLAGEAALRRSDEAGERQLGSLRPGDYLGEHALLGIAAGAWSTATATSDCRVAEIAAADFHERIVPNGDNRAVFDRTIVSECPPIRALDAEARQRVLEEGVEATVPAGVDIITQGTKGESFFVLVEGTVEVVQTQQGGHVVKLTELGPGAYFGEQALLGNASGLRSASVRAVTACRVHSIGAEVFATRIAASGRNRERFERDASTYVYRELTKSLNAFISSELDETSEGVERLVLADGEEIVHEGDPSDCAFLILGGNAKVWKQIDGQLRELTRMGAGQIFGEMGALKGEPRTATVVADGEIELLRIGKDAFVRWHAAHPNASGFFQSLSQVYTLSEGRKVNLFLGEVGGESAVTSVVGTPTDGVVSTRVLSQGVVVFTNARAESMAGERASMTYADDAIKRELRLIVKERKGEKLGRCVVYAVSAEGIENDLGTLYQHVLNFDDVEAVALRRFESTGFLGGKADRTERLCPCLGLGPAELRIAVAELGSDFDTLSANIGVGTICGGCERAVRAFLERGDDAPVVEAEREDADRRDTDEPIAPIPASSDVAPIAPVAPLRPLADVPESLLNRDERQLASLIGRGLGPELGSVTREQVAVRLRATGVRDMNSFIDMLFPGVFTVYARATYATLATAVGRGIGFGPWRADALQPMSRGKAAWLKVARTVARLGHRGVAAVLLAAMVVSFALSPFVAVYVWLAAAAAVFAAHRALSRTPSGRA